MQPKWPLINFNRGRRFDKSSADCSGSTKFSKRSKCWRRAKVASTLRLRGEREQLSFKNFLVKFWWFEPIFLMNFDFGPYRLQNFGKILWRLLRPYWDKFWKILNCEFWWNRKVMINHRGGILIFCQNLNIFVKIENFKSLTLAQIQILDP